VTCFDAAYPASLRRLPDAPPILSVFGCDDIVTKGKYTVLSSRGAESALGETQKSAWKSAVEAGWVPVAGHNRGVYQWGLLAAKRSAAGAVMVLDRGLLAAFDDDLRRDPVPAARIWGYGFEAERSLAVSPFRLRDPFIGRNNRIRDAIVAALADVIIAIGVREGGWMHHLCLDALGRGQTVFASRECLALLADAGAREWIGAAPTALGEQSAARSS
jgi:predicted Rossmann fold nucleotide-binding protein DprA/Smf involved in DNA uptake